MACSIADNRPLALLREDLGIPKQCHSFRKHCIDHLPTPSGHLALGVPGAALGYCQALFNRSGSPASHTERVKLLLAEIGAPWAHSHELFWGYRAEESAAEYVAEGVRPLLGNGRVPILISALEVARDAAIIADIVQVDPPVFTGETVLLRVLIENEASIPAAADLISRLLTKARSRSEMPKWWPLLQGTLTPQVWEALRDTLGDWWRYVNVAVNPFTDPTAFDVIREQVTVVQVPIGHPDGIHRDGMVVLPANARISGAPDQAAYSPVTFARQIHQLQINPTLIVLGPSRPEWTDAINQNRIVRLLPILKESCELLWGSVQTARREMLWRLSA